MLILGSFPSIKSREAMFFYGHPQNRFWPLLALLTGEPTPQTVEEKRALAFTRTAAEHLAFWRKEPKNGLFLHPHPSVGQSLPCRACPAEPALQSLPCRVCPLACFYYSIIWLDCKQKKPIFFSGYEEINPFCRPHFVHFLSFLQITCGTWCGC